MSHEKYGNVTNNVHRVIMWNWIVNKRWKIISSEGEDRSFICLAKCVSPLPAHKMNVVSLPITRLSLVDTDIGNMHFSFSACTIRIPTLPTQNDNSQDVLTSSELDNLCPDGIR